MNHPFEIPQYVYKSAQRVSDYFARQNITDWALGHIRSRYGKLFAAVVVSNDLSSPFLKVFEAREQAEAFGRALAEEELDRRLTDEEAEEFLTNVSDMAFFIMEVEIE